nr:hypothetical protein CFP56_74317 [Quercus suber]
MNFAEMQPILDEIDRLCELSKGKRGPWTRSCNDASGAVNKDAPSETFVFQKTIKMLYRTITQAVVVECQERKGCIHSLLQEEWQTEDNQECPNIDFAMLCYYIGSSFKCIWAIWECRTLYRHSRPPGYRFTRHMKPHLKRALTA